VNRWHVRPAFVDWVVLLGIGALLLIDYWWGVAR
jgi:hypothetical protein